MTLASLDRLCVDRKADLGRAEVRRAVAGIMKKEPLAFVVGSGASLLAPSNVPRGGVIVEQLAEHLSDGVEQRSFAREQIKRAAFEAIFQACPDRSWVEELFQALFSASTPNVVHRKIAEICDTRNCDTITTNYDNLLEATGVNWSKIVDQNEFISRRSGTRLYKIHGTIERKDTLVFSVSAEAPLQGWKLDQFNEIVAGKTVVIVGYSGLDFEICPALLASKANAIVWNMYGKLADFAFPSPNCEHIFRSDLRMRIVSGDMCDLLQVRGQMGAGDGRQQISDFFQRLPRSVFLAWQLTLLDNIGLAKQADHVLRLNANDVPQSVAERIRTGISYRRGRYLSSAWHAARASRHRTGFSSVAFAASVAAAFRLRNYGSKWRTRVLWRIADWQWQSVDQSTKVEFQSTYPWLQYLMVSGNKGNTAKALQLAEIVARESLARGEWGLFYLVEPALAKAGINAGKLVGIDAPLLPGRQGFAHIGNLSSFVDDFTAAIPVEKPGHSVISERIGYARCAELHPNRWKLALSAMIYLSRNEIVFRRYLFKNFLIALSKCQYSLTTKIGIFIQGTRAYFGLPARQIL